MRRVTQAPEAFRYAGGQEGLISTRQCDDVGVSSDRRSALVAHGLWSRVVRGVYDTDLLRTVDHPADHARRRAAWIGLLAMGPDATAVGACALALRGVRGLPAKLTPEVALPGGRGVDGPPGVIVRRYQEVPVTLRINGFGVSDVRTALVHALPLLSRESGVSVLDSALNLGRLREADLPELRRGMRRRKGTRRLEPWWGLVDGRAESPLETWARLDCHDHDLPPDDLQVRIHDPGGRLLARGDMGWRRADGTWVIAELDGREVHGAPEALFRDRERQNALMLRSGVVMLRFTSQDVRASGTIAAQVRRALRSNP